jgi:hypothetical protein
VDKPTCNELQMELADIHFATHIKSVRDLENLNNYNIYNEEIHKLEIRNNYKLKENLKKNDL